MGSFDFITLFFLVAAVIIFLQLRSVLGKRTGNERPPVDPYSPREVAHFIPAVTEQTDRRCVVVAGTERCKVAIQTNNVETDERGYIYIVDRANTGLHILELTGPARAVAGLPKS